MEQSPVFAAPAARRTLRASNDDRQRVMDQLQAHYVAGRLNTSELEGRLEQALAGQTLADLDQVLADLPAADASPADRRQCDRRFGDASARQVCLRKSFQANAASYLLVMALLVGIWLLTTPGGYFWPIWPMMGWGIGLASHGLATSRQSSVVSSQ